MSGGNLKPPFSPFILIFLLLVSLQGIARDVNLYSLLTKEELKWFKENKHNIRYAPNPSWPPGDYVEEGIHKGVVSDYVRIFEEMLGVKFHYVYYNTWSDIIEALKRSEVDLVGGIQHTDERAAYLNFTRVFHTNTVGIITRKNFDKSISKPQNLKLASVEDYAITAHVRELYPDTEIVEFKSDFWALMSTSYAETDATIVDHMTASYLVNKHNISNLQFADQFDYVWQLRFASIKEKPYLASIVDKLLGLITVEEQEKIVSRWIAFDIMPASPFYEKYKNHIWSAVVVLLISLLIILFFSIYLKKQIRIKTAELIQARDKAIKNEYTSRSLFENHSVVKLIVDPDSGNIFDANNAAEVFYGYKISELKKMNINQINLLTPNEIKIEREKAKANKQNHFEFKHCKADGSVVEVEEFSSEVFIDNKLYVHSIVHDITEKKKAEARLQLLSRAVAASSVSVVITDAEGNINYVNPYFSVVSQYSSEEVMGKNPRILKSDKQSDTFYKNLWDTLLAGNDWTGVFQNRKKNGEMHWEQAVISPIMNKEGVITNFVAIKEDITSRIEAEEELNKTMEELKRFATNLQNVREDEKILLAREIHDDLGQLLVALKMNSSSALKALGNDNQIDLDKLNNLMSSQTEIIDKAIISTRRIMNGLRPVKLVMLGFTDAAKELIQEFASRYNIACDFSIGREEVKLEQDTTLALYRILQETLTNIAKHAKASKVKIRYLQIENEIHFEVVDDGVGFDQGHIHRDDSYGLLGLNERVAILGGKLTIESVIGKGTKIHVVFPVLANQG